MFHTQDPQDTGATIKKKFCRQSDLTPEICVLLSTNCSIITSYLQICMHIHSIVAGIAQSV